MPTRPSTSPLPPLAQTDTLLLPAPRSLEFLGGTTPIDPAATPWRVTLDRASPASVGGRAIGTIADQSFTLRIDTSTILCAAGSKPGERHARVTFAQLARRFGKGPWPRMVIHDAPAFATRGVMLDVSRDRVPTMTDLLTTIDLLASLKFNHLQLYTEHTFEYPGHAPAWSGWSPITPDEARRLDLACHERGIELAANQNCFGHLASWLRLPEYAPLAETHGDWVFDVWPRSGPFSICPTDAASLRFVEGLLDSLLPCFSAPLVNIGADETYDVGFGRSADAVAARGRAAVYMDFISSLARAATLRGKRPMFWADVALSHPEAVAHIPAELLSLAWGYEPDSPFDRWCSTLAAAGREAWVCPGTMSWRSIFGRTTERRGNFAAATTAGLAHGASGLLACDWGDTGHHQQWPISAHALAHAAAAGWSGTADAFDPRAASLHAHGDTTLAVGPWLEELGDTDLPLREVALGLSRPGVQGRLRNQSALFIDMHTPWGAHAEVGMMNLWNGARDRLSTLAARRPAGLPPLLADELDHTLAYAAFAADRALARRECPNRPMPDGTARIAALTANHRRLWGIRSRRGGLDHSCGFLARIETGPNSSPPAH